ncbi:MAG: ABC transporter substrate-binding protein [Actinobacteria bacterium]|nr:ABC transporter substrate-binding protein [Actinomycetota bacterium]
MRQHCGRHLRRRRCRAAVNPGRTRKHGWHRRRRSQHDRRRSRHRHGQRHRRRHRHDGRAYGDGQHRWWRGGLVYDYDVNNTDYAGERQKECTYFTQDHKIFAFMGGSPYEDYRQCMAKAGVAMVNDQTNFDAATLQRFPYTFPFSGMSLTRQAAVVVDGLHAQGFFGGGKNIGLIYSEAPEYKRNVPAVERALARYGLKIDPANEFGISVASNQDAASGAQAAELKFKTNNVDRVLFMANQPLFLGVFMLNASSQNYYPRYGVSSYESPAVVEQNVPDKKQFDGLMGVGWLPYGSDVDELPAYTPLAKACVDDYRKAGITAGSQSEESSQLLTCDLYDFFVQAVGRAGRSLNASSFTNAVRGITSLPVRYTFRVDTRPHPDGVAAVRYFRWNGSKLVYTSGERPIA